MIFEIGELGKVHILSAPSLTGVTSDPHVQALLSFNEVRTISSGLKTMHRILTKIPMHVITKHLYGRVMYVDVVYQATIKTQTAMLCVQ